MFVALFGSVEVLSGPDEVGRCAAGLAAAAASSECYELYYAFSLLTVEPPDGSGSARIEQDRYTKRSGSAKQQAQSGKRQAHRHDEHTGH